MVDEFRAIRALTGNMNWFPDVKDRSKRAAAATAYMRASGKQSDRLAAALAVLGLGPDQGGFTLEKQLKEESGEVQDLYENLKKVGVGASDALHVARTLVVTRKDGGFVFTAGTEWPTGRLPGPLNLALRKRGYSGAVRDAVTKYLLSLEHKKAQAK